MGLVCKSLKGKFIIHVKAFLIKHLLKKTILASNQLKPYTTHVKYTQTIVLGVVAKESSPRHQIHSLFAQHAKQQTKKPFLRRDKGKTLNSQVI